MTPSKSKTTAASRVIRSMITRDKATASADFAELVFAAISAGSAVALSFRSQRNHRIHRRRAARGHVARDERDQREERRRRDEAQRIGRAHVVQLTRDDARVTPNAPKTPSTMPAAASVAPCSTTSPN